MSKLTDEDLQALLDKMSDDDLDKIEALAQGTRKRRKKMRWVNGGEVYQEMKRLFDG
jgi:hypothetical protein